MSGGINGPTGTCAKHGPFLYFCYVCHEKWRAKHPKTSEAIRKMADPKVSYSTAKKALAQARLEEGQP